MAAVALNTFKTIRAGLTTSYVGIYTCPIGVASVILLAQVTNVSSGTTSYRVTAAHSRPTAAVQDYEFSKGFEVPPNDSVSLLPDGKLVLETGDVIKVKSDEEDTLNIVLSILETAKV